LAVGSVLLLLTSYLPAPFLRDSSKEREDASRPAKRGRGETSQIHNNKPQSMESKEGGKGLKKKIIH
jgi:hypothetical protein